MLNIGARYPSQLDTGDPGYPLGKARNVTTEGDGTGTPLEKDLVNDLLGFQQALLAYAGLAPTGTPDKVGACQQLDAVKFAADMGRLTYNVKLRGATGLGVVDESAKFTATETALASLGGGTVFIPPGRYVLPAEWVKNPLVSWTAIPGTVVITLISTAGAFDNFIRFASGTGGREVLFEGIDFESDVNTEGVLFQAASASGAVLARFRQCRVNKGSSRLKGRVAFCDVAGSKFFFERCDLASKADSIAAFSVPYLEISDGSASLSPGAATPLVAGGADGMRIEKVRFSHISTGGGISFIQPNGGVCYINGNDFYVDDSSAGAGTSAIAVNSSAEYHVDGNSFSGNTAPYQFIARSKRGSRLQLLETAQSAAAGPITIAPGTAVAFITITGNTAPNVVMADALAEGDDLTLCVKNAFGSGTWAGPVTLSGSATLLNDHVNSPPLLANGKAVIYRFTAITVGVTKYWLQVAQALVIN